MSYSITDAGATQILGDTTSNSLRNIVYDINGSIVIKNDRSAIIPGTTSGMLLSASDYNISKLSKASSEGTLNTSKDILLFFDSYVATGAVFNTNIWLQTLSTMTQAVNLGLGRTFNSGNSKTSGAFAINTSIRQFPLIPKSKLSYQSHILMQTHALNNVMEVGFGAPATGAAINIVNGAIWRKTIFGQLVPIVVLNNSELSGTPITFDTYFANIATNEYAIFSILVDESRAIFKVATKDGTIISEQIIDYPSSFGTFGAGHLQLMERTYNAAAVPATPTSLVSPAMIITRSSVYLLNVKGYSWQQSMDGMSRGSSVGSDASFTYIQPASYANSIAPVSAALSNGTALFSGNGGQYSITVGNSSENDCTVFAGGGNSFVITRISISAYSAVGVGDATTPTILQWSVGLNAATAATSGISNVMGRSRVLGFHTFPVSAAIGTSGGPDIVWESNEINTTGYIQIIARQVLGTNAGTQTVRGTCYVEGYYL